jgi:hypothetical protein
MAVRKGSTIGSNPLDSVVPMHRTPVPDSPTPPDDKRVGRERVTISLPADLMERARNAVFWTPGATLAGLVEDAVAEEMARREKENEGQFKARSAALRPGRRVGS